MMKNKIWHTSRGFTVIEMLMTLSITFLVVGIAGVTIYNFNKSKVGIERDQILAQMRTEIERVIRNPAAYQVIKTKNPAVMACLLSKSNCAGASGEIDLYDEKGNLLSYVTKSTASTVGFSPTGASCSQFSQVNGNPLCPFKWTAVWRAVCKTNPCLNPVVQISASLNYSSNSPVGSFQTSKYFVLHQYQQEASQSSSVCASVGGVLVNMGNGSTKCVKPSGTFVSSCPSGQYVKGFDPQGNVICRAFPETQCPVGSLLQGINADGTAQCGQGCKAQIASSCYPSVNNLAYGSQVKSLLSRGIISPSQVKGMGCK